MKINLTSYTINEVINSLLHAASLNEAISMGETTETPMSIGHASALAESAEEQIAVALGLLGLEAEEIDERIQDY